MIITKTEPFTKEEIKKLSEQFHGVYIKTVIDLQRKVCSAGASLHVDNEAILIKDGSEQKDVWGGGIDIETKTIDDISMINTRGGVNPSQEILDEETRSKYEELTKYFFKELWTN